MEFVMDEKKGDSDYDQLSLPQLITYMIEKGVLVDESNQYKCICDSNIQRQRVRAHLQSKKHQEFMRYGSYEEMKKAKELDKKEKLQKKRKEYQEKQFRDCDICCRSEKKFYTCTVCRNSHCLKCNSKVERCPFCRNSFMDVKFKKEFDRRILQIRSIMDEEHRAEKYYSFCRYVIQHKQIIKMDKYKNYYEAFKDMLVTNYYNGFESAPIFIQLLTRDD